MTKAKTTHPVTADAVPPTPPPVIPGPAPGATAVGAVMFIDLPAAQFQAIVAQIAALLAQILALLVNPTHLTPDQRKHSGGKLRDGEAEALLDALNVARAYPANFVSLSTMDNGVDPSTFEVDLVANRLQNAAALLPVVTTLEALDQTFADCMLVLNEEARSPAKEVYALAKALARSVPAVESMIASTVTYYAKIALASAASRAANKAEAASLAHGTGDATITAPAPTAPKTT